jgi:hypothetical protein
MLLVPLGTRIVLTTRTLDEATCARYSGMRSVRRLCLPGSTTRSIGALPELNDLLVFLRLQGIAPEPGKGPA